MNKSQWENWKHSYNEQIQQIGDTQSLFIDTILSHIPEIQPSDVIPHYRFVDGDGANRYIDFLIINQDNNYLLPIEINGYAKIMGNQYDALNQFLEGKKAILARFGIVLCYSNQDMINERENIVYEIRQTLENQNLFKSNEKIIASHTAQLIDDYEHKLTELSREQLQTHNNEHVLPLIKEMQQEINRLKQQQIPALPDANNQSEEDKYFEYGKEQLSNKSRFLTIALSVICSAVIVFFFTKKLMSKDDNAGYQIKDKVIERKDVEQEKKQHLAMIEEQDKDIQEPDFKVEPRRDNKPAQTQKVTKAPVKQQPKPTPKPVQKQQTSNKVVVQQPKPQPKPTPQPVQPSATQPTAKPKPQPVKAEANNNKSEQTVATKPQDKKATTTETNKVEQATQELTKQAENAKKQAEKAKQELEKQVENAKKQVEKTKQELEKQTENAKKQAEKAKQELEKQTENAKKQAEKAKQELEKQTESAKKQAEKTDKTKQSDKQKNNAEPAKSSTKNNDAIEVVESNEQY